VHLLTHPEEAGLSLLLREHRLSLRVVHSPAFAAHHSWSLFAPRAPDGAPPPSVDLQRIMRDVAALQAGS
jgi:hypothetical protein